MEEENIPSQRWSAVIEIPKLGRDEPWDQFWEIGVPREYSVYWSTLLAVVIQQPNHEASHGIFERALSEMIDGIISDEDGEGNADEGSIAQLVSLISSYNPFLDRYECFADSRLQVIIKSFEKEVLSAHQRAWAQNEKYSDCELTIDIISLILKCKITLVLTSRTDRNSSEPTILSFNDVKSNSVDIVVFGEGTETDFRVVSFGFSRKRGNDKQEEALTTILEDLPDNIFIPRDLFRLDGCKENVLVTLFRMGLHEELEEILKLPMYIIEKLCEAGFPIDPTKGETIASSDEPLGKHFDPTSIFYAISLEKWTLLWQLYSCALKKSCPPNCNVRCPDPSLTKNMNRVTQVLRETEKFTEMPDNDQNSRQRCVYLQELIKFHEFQVQVQNKIAENTSSEITNSSEGSTVRKDANYLKKTLCDIFGLYNIHNRVEKTKKDVNNFYDRFDEVNDFFLNLDIAVALRFFDNTYRLRTNLRSKGWSHERLDSCFLQSIFLCMCYYTRVNENFARRCEKEKAERNIDIFTLLDNVNMHFREIFLMVSILERRNIYFLLKNYCEILSNISINDENIRDHVPLLEETNMLRSVPEVKEKLLILRLQRHLSLAVAVNLQENFEVGHLIIIRALQVLGEAVKLTPLAEPTLIKSFLVAFFPKEIATDLVHLRNMLCDHEHSNVSKRMGLKKECLLPLFIGIQDDLAIIEQSLKYLFVLESIKFQKYLERKWSHSCNALERYVNKMPTDVRKLIEKQKQGQKIKSNYLKENASEKDLDEMQKNCKMKNSNYSMESASQKCIDEMNRNLPNYFQNLLARIQNHLRSKECKREKEIVFYLIQCLVCMLKFTINSRMQENKPFVQCQNLTDLINVTLNKYSSFKTLLKSIEKYRNIVSRVLLELENSGGEDGHTNTSHDDPDCRHIRELLNKLNCTNIIENKNLEFFLAQLKLMKKLLTEYNSSSFKTLWGRVNNEKMKVYYQEKFISVYVGDRSLQVSIEVLLYDCMELLKRHNTGLAGFWIKADNLFNGMDLRNFFAHGNPLFEAVCEIFDPLDLPNEVLKKSLEFLDDIEAVESILYLKMIVSDDYDELHQFITSGDAENEFPEEYDRIIKCVKWESYLELLKKVKKRGYSTLNETETDLEVDISGLFENEQFVANHYTIETLN